MTPATLSALTAALLAGDVDAATAIVLGAAPN